MTEKVAKRAPGAGRRCAPTVAATTLATTLAMMLHGGEAGAYINGFPSPDLTPTFDRVAELRVPDISRKETRNIAPGRRYRVARICVGFRSVEFQRVEVTLANGETSRLRVKRLLKPGECTRELSLEDRKGAAQRVKSISFRYSAYVKSGLQPMVGVFMR